MNSFRVTLFLQHFFSDQRASCRVYITSQMKTIQDLQSHINGIFHLDKDFYLISNNLYLPNAEDVRVLKEDDIVIAVPCNLTQLQPCNDRTELGEVAEPNKALKKRSGLKRKRSISVTNCNDLEKKKNRKKSELENNHYVNVQIVHGEKKENNEEDKLVTDNYSKKKKKSKKFKSEDNDVEFPNDYDNKKKKKKNKGKVEKSLSNDKDHVNDKKEKLTVFDTVITMKIGNTRSDFKENNNNLSKTIPSSTPLRVSKSKPKKLELMKISSIPKVIKTIHVYDREPIANNKVVDELSECKECENEAMVPTADNSNEGSKVTKLLDDDHLVEYPEEVSVSNSFVTLKSFVDNADNNDPNPHSIMTSSINDRKTDGFTEDEKCKENVDKSIISSLDSYRIKPISDSEVSLSIDEKCKEKLQSNSTDDAEIISIMNNEDQLKEISENKKVHVLDNVCVQPAVTDKNSTRNSVISTEEVSESIASITTDEASLELFKPKRKRKRIRRRKVKPPVENGVFETPLPVFTKPNNIPTPSNKHIKFEDGNEDGILKDQQAQQSQSNIDNTVSDQNNQQDVAENVNIVRVIENASSPFSYEKLCKEEIMKYPVMGDIYPKIGDIIAFKIYVLSEHYTPEISNFIIAKVVNYDTENKIVFLRFLGGEQCTEPEGKFYMETVSSQPKSGDRYFSWEALKEPRLLFP